MALLVTLMGLIDTPIYMDIFKAEEESTKSGEGMVHRGHVCTGMGTLLAMGITRPQQPQRAELKLQKFTAMSTTAMSTTAMSTTAMSTTAMSTTAAAQGQGGRRPRRLAC